jgi:hypothetical protein
MEDKTFPSDHPGSSAKTKQDRRLERRRRSEKEYEEMKQLAEEAKYSSAQTQIIIYVEPRRFLF